MNGRGILFTGAFAPEVDLLRRAGIRHEVLETGVGGLSAALGLRDFLDEGPPPDEIVFLGSAGVYVRRKPEADLVGGIVCVRSFHNRELSAMEGRGKVPDPMPSFVETDMGSFAKLLQERQGLREGQVNCPDSITLVEPAGFAGLPDGLLLENMETFGLALVAKQHSVPFAAFLALTNVVGPGGSDGWARNFRTLSDKLQGLVLECLGEG